MIIKWPERYSLVMLLHAFIHELKYRTEMTNKQQENRKWNCDKIWDISSDRRSATKSNEWNETTQIFCVHKIYRSHRNSDCECSQTHCHDNTFPFCGEQFLWVKVAASDRKKSYHNQRWCCQKNKHHQLKS